MATMNGIIVLVLSISPVLSLDNCGESLWTDTTYYFRYLSSSPIPVTRIDFLVKASNDVHIGLSTEPYDTEPMYKIIIGGWTNTQSAIKRQYLTEVVVDTPGLLNQDKFKAFWIEYNVTTGVISVGEPCGGEFMQWIDPNPLSVDHVGYSTAFDSSGEFRFCTNTTVEEDNTCSMENSITIDSTDTIFNLTSPNYPDDYPACSQCTFKISASSSEHRVQLSIRDFSLENCPYDWLNIRHDVSDSTLENVALGKTASQSSSYDVNDPNAAIDGNNDSNWGGNSCSHTMTDYNPWWKVDLGRSYPVLEVIITNRQDCCAERLLNAEVRIGDSSDNFDSNTLCGDPVGSDEVYFETITFTCDGAIHGRYVSVQLKHRTDYLTLCEVEVISYSSEDILNATLCGNTYPTSFTSREDKELIIEFHSDNTIQERGFDITYSSFAVGTSCPPSWYQYGENCYKVNNNPLPWYTAQTYCGYDASNLISIDSYEDQQTIKSLLSSHQIYWIGLVYRDSNFQHIDRSDVIYNGVDLSYFDYNSDEICVSMNAFRDSMDTEDCNTTFSGFICEKNIYGNTVVYTSWPIDHDVETEEEGGLAVWAIVLMAIGGFFVLVYLKIQWDKRAERRRGVNVISPSPPTDNNANTTSNPVTAAPARLSLARSQRRMSLPLPGTTERPADKASGSVDDTNTVIGVIPRRPNNRLPPLEGSNLNHHNLYVPDVEGPLPSTPPPSYCDLYGNK